MKPLQTLLILMIWSASALAVELPVDLDPPSTAPAGSEPADGSSFVGGEQRSQVDVALVDPKDQKLARVQLKKQKEAIVVLFETSKLPQSNFSLTIENGCGLRSATGAANSVKNGEIRDIRIRGQFYSDEFKLKGYAFGSEGSAKHLEGKALKLYQISKDAPPKQVACGIVK